MNLLAGRPLKYLIGADNDGIVIARDAVTVVPFDYERKIRDPWVIGYGNLFWQRGAPDCPPYLKNTDTADEYDERVVDPRGRGWDKNLKWQFARWQKLNASVIELDNAAAYDIADVIGAIELAASYGLKVIAKNPCLLGGGSVKYVAHPSIYGIIVERDEDVTPLDMEQLRRGAGKPDLPVWFVAFGRKGKSWADGVAHTAKNYRNMGVTVSRRGEYTDSIDILRPHT